MLLLLVAELMRFEFGVFAWNRCGDSFRYLVRASEGWLLAASALTILFHAGVTIALGRPRWLVGHLALIGLVAWLQWLHLGAVLSCLANIF